MFLLFSALLLSALSQPAAAGERVFAFSYGYGNVPQGGVELEQYTTASLPPGVDPTWKHQTELEYGITDRLEGGLYLVAENLGAGPLVFDGFKGRLKYRFGSQGVAPIDVAAYLEYIGSPDLKEHGAEAKLILGKDLERFHGAFNLEYKLEFGEGELKHEVEPALGLGYAPVPSFVLGAEAKGGVELEEGELEGPLFWAGPMVHLAGEGGKLWWTFAALAPLGSEAADADGWVLRSLVAVNL